MATAFRRPARRTFALLAVLVVLAGTVGAWGSGPAEASSYRYWSYWIGGGDGWGFSTQGAARRPADGTVDGWRFSISEASSSTTPPRREPSFARICGDTAPVAGSKRVGLVVDFGTTSDAPPGETPPALLARCVVVPEDANGYDVLATTVSLRTQDGLVCGLAGYPATECGAPVADSSPTGEPKDPEETGETGGGSSTGEVAGGSASPTTSDGGAGGGSGTDRSDEDQRSKRKADKADKGAESAPDEVVPGDATAVAAPVGSDATPSGGEGSSTAVLVGVALIAVIGGAAWVVQRRRG
jgi:hypothetical protein